LEEQVTRSQNTRAVLGGSHGGGDELGRVPRLEPKDLKGSRKTLLSPALTRLKEGKRALQAHEPKTLDDLRTGLEKRSPINDSRAVAGCCCGETDSRLGRGARRVKRKK